MMPPKTFVNSVATMVLVTGTASWFNTPRYHRPGDKATGLELVKTRISSSNAAGLKLASRDTVPKPWIGLTTREGGDRLFVGRIVDGSPAREAGIDGGDEIVALDGRKVTGRDFDKAVSGKKKGDKITLTMFRDNVLREYSIKVKDSPVPEYDIEKISDPMPGQELIYEQWLSTKWE